MPNFRRFYVPGGLYFFTVVTQDRRPILTTKTARKFLRTAIETEARKRPFTIVAIVLLPDHLHTVWSLPDGDADYSTRWKQIKEAFTEAYLAADGTEGTRSTSRAKHGERGVWQKRFWEHTIRDEDDLKRCIDYVHWNPVKHRFSEWPCGYQWSTFHRFVKLGEYDLDWGRGEVTPLDIPGAEWE